MLGFMAFNFSSESSSTSSSTNYEAWNNLPPSVKRDYLLNFGEIPFKRAVPLAIYDPRVETRNPTARTPEDKVFETRRAETIVKSYSASDDVQENIDSRKSVVRDQDIL